MRAGLRPNRQFACARVTLVMLPQTPAVDWLAASADQMGTGGFLMGDSAYHDPGEGCGTCGENSLLASPASPATPARA